MTTINIKNLIIQADVHDSHIEGKGDSRLRSLKNEAYSVIETINEALQNAGLNCQAQIVDVSLNISDIEEVDKTESKLNCEFDSDENQNMVNLSRDKD